LREIEDLKARRKLRSNVIQSRISLLSLILICLIYWTSCVIHSLSCANKYLFANLNNHNRKHKSHGFCVLCGNKSAIWIKFLIPLRDDQINLFSIANIYTPIYPFICSSYMGWIDINNAEIELDTLLHCEIISLYFLLRKEIANHHWI
jgi:hypothetical protein